jgi:hypothetical protein
LLFHQFLSLIFYRKKTCGLSRVGRQAYELWGGVKRNIAYSRLGVGSLSRRAEDAIRERKKHAKNGGCVEVEHSEIQRKGGGFSRWCTLLSLPGKALMALTMQEKTRFCPVDGARE